jgi:hypothetical protein
MTRRAFCILLTFLAVSLGLRAQGYCCDRQGAQLEYVRKKVKDGSTEWRHIVNVKDVKKGPDGSVVTSVSTFLKANGKPYYKGDITERVTLRPNNDVWVDMEDVTVEYVKGRFGLNATAEAAPSIIPADMQPGDTLPQVSGKGKVSLVSFGYRIWDRKVLRRETLVVPAGTFECVVLEEHKVESGPGHNRDVLNHTWYSKGVGYVRHDTYIDGKLDTSEVLNSITK